MERTITLTVNGTVRTTTTDPARSLLHVLREEFGLTGTKYACGEGHCGACNVLMDGRLERSCVTSISMAEGKAVVTLEGMSDGDTLHPVQEAFLEEHAVQCGYCTSGMIMAATALLQRNAEPTEGDDAGIRRRLGLRHRKELRRRRLRRRDRGPESWGDPGARSV